MAAGTASSASTAAPGSCTKAAAAARRVAAEGRGGRVGGGRGIARAAEVSVRGEGSVAECGVRIGGGAGGGAGAGGPGWREIWAVYAVGTDVRLEGPIFPLDGPSLFL